MENVVNTPINNTPTDNNANPAPKGRGPFGRLVAGLGKVLVKHGAEIVLTACVLFVTRRFAKITQADADRIDAENKAKAEAEAAAKAAEAK